MSAELEIAGCNNYRPIEQAVNKWSASVVRDGSLPQLGFEINTAPASLTKFEDQANELAESLKMNAWVNEQCGAHVHIDCRDFDFGDVLKLMAIWTVAEPLMYDIVAPSRRDNHYCEPMAENFRQHILTEGGSTPRLTVFRSVYGRSPDRGYNLLTVKQSKNGPRYKSLNLHSWAYRGTIENRMHEGMTTADEIQNWCYINAALADAAVNRVKLSEVTKLAKTKPVNEARSLFLSWLPDDVASWASSRLSERSR
jgi:hypothetical protein